MSLQRHPDNAHATDPNGRGRANGELPDERSAPDEGHVTDGAGHGATRTRRRRPPGRLHVAGRGRSHGDGAVADRYPPLDWRRAWKEAVIEPDFLIPYLIERGRNYALVAPGKQGKSLLVLDLCVALATGRPILGRANPSKGPVRVLYLDRENPLSDVVARITEMGAEPDDLDDLIYVSFPSIAPLDTEKGGQELLALVRYHNVDLVVIDSFIRFVSGDEDASSTAGAFDRHTAVPIKAEGVALLRIDHTGWDPKRARGSSAKTQDVDTEWIFKWNGGGRRSGSLELSCNYQRNGHHPEWVRIYRQQRTRDEWLGHRIVAVDGVKEAGGGLTPDDEAAIAAFIDRLDELGAPVTGREKLREWMTKYNREHQKDRDVEPLKLAAGLLGEVIRRRREAAETDV
jgi:hypothetical protein